MEELTTPKEVESEVDRESSQLPLSLVGADLASPMIVPFLGGDIVAFTSASPESTLGNEDALGVFEWDDQTGLLIVADGVGGLPDGAKASRQVIEALRDKPTEDGDDQIIDRLHSVNSFLLREGIGATVSVFVIQDSKATSYHAGDTTSLVVGSGPKIKMETIPHSAMGKAVASGEIDEKEAMHHPMRHLVSNFVGMRGMWIEKTEAVHVEHRDTVILASDGLWDNLYRNEVVDQISDQPLEAAAKELVAIAGQRMTLSGTSEPSKPDDLSFILYRPM